MLNEPDEYGNELFTALWHEEELETSIPAGSEYTTDENGLPLNPADENGNAKAVFP